MSAPVSGASAARVRVAVVDDDTLIREGLRTLATSLEVVDVYPTAEDLLADQPTVDVVLLDLNLLGTGRLGGLQGARAVAAISAVPRAVLIYTNERRREVLVGCLSAGARGVVHKAEPISAVEEAVHTIAAGGVVITDALAGLAELVNRSGQLPQLTPREREVLRGRARGETFASIGARLYITPKTAQEYMASTSGKFAEFLRTHSAADLEHRLGFTPGDLLDWGTQ